MVMLCAARTDTLYWHEIIMKTAAEVRFIKGRIKFGGAPHPAPFPSAIIIWEGDGWDGMLETKFSSLELTKEERGL